MPPPLVQMTSKAVMGEPPSEAGVTQVTVTQLSEVWHWLAMTAVEVPGTVTAVGSGKEGRGAGTGAGVGLGGAGVGPGGGEAAAVLVATQWWAPVPSSVGVRKTRVLEHVNEVVR